MIPRRNEIGKYGEDYAVDIILKSNEGYELLDRNFRCVLGEIDLIFAQGDTLVFVEVKTRRSIQYGMPYEAVDQRKINRIRKIALFYVQKMRYFQYELRFDVVSICLDNTCTAISYEHIISAF